MSGRLRQVMASTPFIEFASALVQAMGQRLDAAKPTDEGLVLRTGDGFLYAFLEDPARVSLEAVRKLVSGEAGGSARLVVLTPGRLPPVLAQELGRAGGTLVEGARFAELARQLGLGSWVGEEPRARPPDDRRLLPSALQLDDVMHRARVWLEWGVPALALRFYRQAIDLKPEFGPAKAGLGRALLALGLPDDADREFDEILASRPQDVDARLGKAAVLGARSRPKEEVALYRKLLEEDAARSEVRAHLVAALVDLGDWRSARIEIEAMLTRTPEDPQLRFLHGVALERTGSSALGAADRDEARRLGLPYEREVALCQHLGLPPPPRPVAVEVPVPPAARRAPAPAVSKPAPKAAPASKPVPPPEKAKSRRVPSPVHRAARKRK
jgi:tetratricopeptide (TPR) repeat protein